MGDRVHPGPEVVQGGRSHDTQSCEPPDLCGDCAGQIILLQRSGKRDPGQAQHSAPQPQRPTAQAIPPHSAPGPAHNRCLMMALAQHSVAMFFLKGDVISDRVQPGPEVVQGGHSHVSKRCEPPDLCGDRARKAIVPERSAQREPAASPATRSRSTPKQGAITNKSESGSEENAPHTTVGRAEHCAF